MASPLDSITGKSDQSPAIQAMQELQAKRNEVHNEERNKYLEKNTGTGLLGQKIGGLGGKVDFLA